MLGFRRLLYPCASVALLAMLALGTAEAVAQDAAESPAEAATPAADAQPPASAAATADAAAQGPAGQKQDGENDPAKGDPAQADKPDDRSADAKAGDKQAGDKQPAKPADGQQPQDQPSAEQQKDKPAPPPKPTGPASYPRLPGMGSVHSDPIPGSPWRVHDLFRPRPPRVVPGEVDSSKYLGTTAPSDAVVLFDGTDLSMWAHQDPKDPAVMYPPRWKVQDGYMEVTAGSGSLYTIDSFGSCQLHIEWASPAEPRGSSQGRGNSGIKFFGLYEVQVLDSYENRTYADGQAGAIYGQYPPAVNASRSPGEWQSYDILFNAPHFDGAKVVRPAVVTVIHNGVALHHARELKGKTGGGAPGYRSHPPAGQIMLQDHGNPTRFRNIWIRPLE